MRSGLRREEATGESGKRERTEVTGDLRVR